MLANGIAILNPPRVKQSALVVSNTKGSAISVTDEEIVDWQIQLAQKEGIFAEITASATFAAIKKMQKNNIIKNKESVLIPITGFGLKDPPKNFN